MKLWGPWAILVGVIFLIVQLSFWGFHSSLMHLLRVIWSIFRVLFPSSISHLSDLSNLIPSRSQSSLLNSEGIIKSVIGPLPLKYLMIVLFYTLNLPLRIYFNFLLFHDIISDHFFGRRFEAHNLLLLEINFHDLELVKIAFLTVFYRKPLKSSILGIPESWLRRVLSGPYLVWVLFLLNC